MVVLVETTICMENYQTSKNQISIYLTVKKNGIAPSMEDI